MIPFFLIRNYFDFAISVAPWNFQNFSHWIFLVGLIFFAYNSGRCLGWGRQCYSSALTSEQPLTRALPLLLGLADVGLLVYYPDLFECWELWTSHLSSFGCLEFFAYCSCGICGLADTWIFPSMIQNGPTSSSDLTILLLERLTRSFHLQVRRVYETRLVGISSVIVIWFLLVTTAFLLILLNVFWFWSACFHFLCQCRCRRVQVPRPSLVARGMYCLLCSCISTTVRIIWTQRASMRCLRSAMRKIFTISAKESIATRRLVRGNALGLTGADVVRYCGAKTFTT